jgi:hypothetical protein
MLIKNALIITMDKDRRILTVDEKEVMEKAELAKEELLSRSISYSSTSYSNRGYISPTDIYDSSNTILFYCDTYNTPSNTFAIFN